jgi:DSF synthase
VSSFIHPFPSSFPTEHVRIEYDEARQTLIMALCPSPRPCATPETIEGTRIAMNWVRDLNGRRPDSVRHVILVSDTPGVFSLGGDLDLFVSCIEKGDRGTLMRYALNCVRTGHMFQTGLNGTISTTSVVAGQALGGGLEGAACCQTIIAEEGSTLQLPEIKFGMFPGMGAISYLTRRAPGRHVRQMVETGEPIDLQEAYSVRMVDELAAPGQGIATAHRINERLSQGFHARMATRYALALAQGPTLGELESIAHAWVDVAMKIDLRDMRLMHRLAAHQLRLGVTPRAPAPIMPAPGFALAAAI